MKDEKMKFIKTEYRDSKMIKLQILLSPIMIMLPMIVSILFITEWYTRGFCTGSSDFDVELILGLTILFGNIIFDIPFVKSLVSIKSKLHKY